LKLIPFDRLKPDKGINYCRDHIRRKVKAGEFPKPIELSDRRIAWREDEIDEWLASRPRRDSSSPPEEAGAALQTVDGAETGEFGASPNPRARARQAATPPAPSSTKKGRRDARSGAAGR
jgi:Prophage CP4-57 regulatory protein (AlpA)